MNTLKKWLAIGSLALLAACSSTSQPQRDFDSELLPDTEPISVVLEPTTVLNSAGTALEECSQVKTGNTYDGAYRLPWSSSGKNGIYYIDFLNNFIKISNSTSLKFDWAANITIGAVIVKSSGGSNIYTYDPQARQAAGLVGYQSSAIEHVTFCWLYKIDIKKTAKTTYKRTYKWNIEKTGDQTDLTLPGGQTGTVNYKVKVSSSYTDSDWAVSGVITVKNPGPLKFTIKSVGDLMSPGSIVPTTLDCGTSFPKELDIGQSITCNYSSALPDATARTNRARVEYYRVVNGEVRNRVGAATADVKFGDPTTLVDNCINVSDDKYGDLGKVCASDSPKTFEYKLEVGPYKCGPQDVFYDHINTASFKTEDTGTTGSSKWTVKVKVPACSTSTGCTYTQGYWKTHSDRGPSPYDAGWKKLGALEEDTVFFLSGHTWYEVFGISPQGNAYYILAVQYMAAKLNLLNGASSTAAVDAAITGAEAFFAVKTPASSLTTAEHDQALAWATTLDDYNNGLIGPGHCPN